MNEAPKKILFLTGTRADFGKLKPLIEKLSEADGYEPHIFATGMHMLARYGSTVREIYKAGFDRVHPYINQEASDSPGMDLVLANTVSGLGYYVREFMPDMIVVHGDRVEAMAGAIVGALHNVLVAHVEGGELSGTVDELIRHSVSKLAHLHFVSNERARERLLQMGEIPESIFVIGSPEVDVMLSDRLPPLDKVLDYYEIPFDEYCIFVYHPVTTETETLSERVAGITSALEESERNFVAIYPNNDTGSQLILEAVKRLGAGPRFRVLPSMRFEYFLTLLRHAQAIIGNSSAGVREAPVYGVPTLNLGSRQQNRHRCESILNLPENRDALARALQDLPASTKPSMYFGNGNSSSLFVEALRDGDTWLIPKQKQFRDIGGLGETKNSATDLVSEGVAKI